VERFRGWRRRWGWIGWRGTFFDVGSTDVGTLEVSYGGKMLPVVVTRRG